MTNDYLTSMDQKKEDKKLPALRTYFTVSGMPYEVAEHDVASVVSELVHVGAARIVVERQVVDDNAPPVEPQDVEHSVPTPIDAPAEVYSDPADDELP